MNARISCESPKSSFDTTQKSMSSNLAASTVIFICLLDYIQAVMVNAMDEIRPSQKLPNAQNPTFENQAHH